MILTITYWFAVFLGLIAKLYYDHIHCLCSHYSHNHPYLSFNRKNSNPSPKIAIMEQTVIEKPYYYWHKHDYVEIGGIKWATCNLGAEKPYEVGLYFQWGDTVGYSAEDVFNGNKRFDWVSYKFRRKKLFRPAELIKYSYADNLKCLLPEDDAVHVAWGNGWRLPTKEEFDCLYKSTKHYWIHNYDGGKSWTNNYNPNIVGCSGMMFQSIKEPNKSIFFPVSGCISGGVVLNDDYSYGLYWSNTVSTDRIYASALYFDRNDRSKRTVEYRRFGFPIRGVLDY